MARREGGLLAFATAAALVAGAACSHEWDPYDPRLGAGASASASAAGGAGGTPTGPGVGGSPATGAGAGGSGAGAGGTGGTGVVEDCATAADDDGDGKPNTHCAIWSKRFGDASPQLGHALTIGPQGNILLAGQMDGVADFGGGPLSTAGGRDLFVAKFDPDGGHFWSHTFGGPLDDKAVAIVVDDLGRVVVVGSFAGTVSFGPLAGQTHTSLGGSDALVLVLDAAGEYIWSRSFGGALDDAATSVAVDASGNVFVGGNFAGSANFGSGLVTSAGGLDGFILELTAAGAPAWDVTFGDAGADSVEGVAATPEGGVALTGYFAGAVTLGGAPLVASAADGTDAFVGHLDSLGGHDWSMSFGKDGAMLPQRGQRIRVDAGRNVIVAGTFEGMVDLGGGPLSGKGMDDIFVAKFSTAGVPVWSAGFGSAEPEVVSGLAVDGMGSVVLTGALHATVDFGGGPLTVTEPDDIFLVKIRADGTHDWSRRFGITGDQDGGDVATNEQNEVFLTGFIEGTTDLGDGVLTGAGTDDVLLAKIGP